MPKKHKTLKPLNDYALVEIYDDSEDGLEFQRGEHDSVQKGKVIEIGRCGYISTNAWVYPLEGGMTDDTLYYDDLVGKTIYWEKFTDNNASVDHSDGKKYAFIKLSKIVGFEE